MSADRDDLLRRRARVRITNPANGSNWEGRVISYADFPTIEIEQDDGTRIGLPQHFTVEEQPAFRCGLRRRRPTCGAGPCRTPDSPAKIIPKSADSYDYVKLSVLPLFGTVPRP